MHRSLRFAVFWAVGFLLLQNETLAASPHTAAPIPDVVRRALGCDILIVGSGTGDEKEADKMVSVPRMVVEKKKKSYQYVFWCARSTREYLLVFVTDGKIGHPECTPVVVWRYPPKGRLSIAERSVELTEFVHVDSLGRLNRGALDTDDRNLQGEQLKETIVEMIVQDGDETLMNEFVCVEGAWMFRSLH